MRAGGFHSIRPSYQTESGISVVEPINYIVFYSVIALILVPALAIGRRAFCHYICWMAPFMVVGTKLNDLVKCPALHLKADKTRCIDCKTCTANCPMSLDVNKMVHADSMYDSEYILCGTRVDNCLNKVIEYRFKLLDFWCRRCPKKHLPKFSMENT